MLCLSVYSRVEGCYVLSFLPGYVGEREREGPEVVKFVHLSSCKLGSGLLELGEKMLWPLSTSGLIRS